MKRTSLIVVFLALLAASGFFPGAHTASANELTYELGTAIDPLPLPDDATLHELGGGTPPYTISVSGLPAGVSYDEASRIISGTPSEVGTTVVTITVTDANGASAPLPAFTIEVNAPETSDTRRSDV